MTSSRDVCGSIEGETELQPPLQVFVNINSSPTGREFGLGGKNRANTERENVAAQGRDLWRVTTERLQHNIKPSELSRSEGLYISEHATGLSSLQAWPPPTAGYGPRIYEIPTL